MRRLPILLLASILAVSVLCESHIKAVIHMAYVGSRYPIKAQQALKWKYNPMELTPVGIRQLYLLGREMRRIYLNTALSERYNPIEVNFRSFYSYNKTAVTAAYAFAGGLYHPGTGYTLSSFQNEKALPPWKGANYTKLKEELGNAASINLAASIPIMTLTEDPNYLFEAISLCSNIKTLAEAEVEKDSTLKNSIQTTEKALRAELYPHIKTILELKKDIGSLDEAMDYYDYFISAKYVGEAFSEKLSVKDYDDLKKLYYTVKYKKLLANPKVAQIISYGFLTELSKLLTKIAANNKTEKFTTYMLDDINILALLKLLKVGDKDEIIDIPFASSLVIEITEDNKIMKVTIKFNKKEIVLPDNYGNTVANFTKWVKSNTLKDFKNSCNLFDISVPKKWFVITLIIGGVFLVIIIVTWVLVHICRRSKEEVEELESTLECNPTATDK